MDFVFEKLAPVRGFSNVDLDAITDYLFEIYSFKNLTGNSTNDINSYVDILLQFFRSHINLIFSDLNYICKNDYLSQSSCEDINKRLSSLLKNHIILKLKLQYGINN